MGHLENYLETLTKELGSYNDEYVDLYNTIAHTVIRSIFSTLHANIISAFKTMNSRLPSGEYGSHFWADPSRDLIYTISRIEGLQRVLKQTNFAFSIEKNYDSIIQQCKGFLSESGGSTIPPGIEKIEIYYTTQIFIQNNTISITRKEDSQTFELKLIGEGSYAQVFKYYDTHYQRFYVIKRAKKNLNEKELKRFQQEYQEMSKLHSPYIVEVYCYNTGKNEFTMEYMNYTLCDYISKNNDKLTELERKNICAQIIKAFTYIHSKGLLHRDISPTNILIREYDDVIVVKIADFGLVKTPESKLTSMHSEIKGSFNDPALRIDGFYLYNIKHEIYALTIILCFVMTGSTNINLVKKPELQEFAKKGMNPDKSLRFSDINELYNSFREI
jgi:serine/threonine-protein kinase